MGPGAHIGIGVRVKVRVSLQGTEYRVPQGTGVWYRAHGTGDRRG